MKGLILLLNSIIVLLQLSYFGNKMRVIFNGICLKQNKITYTLKK